MSKFTPRQEAFVREYLVDLNATQAAIRAGYSKKTATEQASRLLTDVNVREAVDAKRERLAIKTEITVERVLEELWAIATADANELIEHRRIPCPSCFEGVREPKKKPRPDCDECHGEGIGQAFIKDSRFLSATAKRLYSGVKITKGGIEVKMQDRMIALQKVGQHLGMFKEQIEHSGTLTLEALVAQSMASSDKDKP